MKRQALYDTSELVKNVLAYALATAALLAVAKLLAVEFETLSDVYGQHVVWDFILTKGIEPGVLALAAYFIVARVARYRKEQVQRVVIASELEEYCQLLNKASNGLEEDQLVDRISWNIDQRPWSRHSCFTLSREGRHNLKFLYKEYGIFGKELRYRLVKETPEQGQPNWTLTRESSSFGFIKSHF